MRGYQGPGHPEADTCSAARAVLSWRAGWGCGWMELQGGCYAAA
jgi:hypothetical protein